MFRLLQISFDNFDAKLGEPDQVERMLVRAKSMVGKSQRMYLILDDINSDACYQTTSEDLASISDFLTLKEETFLISQKYRAQDRKAAIEMTLLISLSKMFLKRAKSNIYRIYGSQ